MKCPKCGANASGKFCGECGTPLAGATCRSCNAALAAGANFCTQCGTRVHRRAAPMPWLVGGLLLLTGAAVTWAMLRDPSVGPVAPAMDGAPAGGGSPPALSGNMRENADRLFNRIMQSRENGDTAGAQQFLPMAISAYESSELDADGFYHLSILQSLSVMPDQAMATARKILDDDPTHLLGLHAAAMAARAGNKKTDARQFYQKLLDEFETEKAKSRPEYADHAALLDALPQEARDYIASK